MSINSSVQQEGVSAPGRKAQERVVHRQMMLRAAEQVFARKGFREATIGEIARAADFAVGTFYNFFKSKEDLYAQVFDGIAREFMAEFERDVQQRDDPVDALSRLIDLRMQIFGQHRGFFRFFFDQSAVGVKVTQKHRLFREQYRVAVSEIFDRGITRGKFDPMDPLLAAICLDGMLNAIVRYWSAHEGETHSEAQLSKTKRMILDRFCHQGQ